MLYFVTSRSISYTRREEGGEEEGVRGSLQLIDNFDPRASAAEYRVPRRYDLTFRDTERAGFTCKVNGYTATGDERSPIALTFLASRSSAAST